MRRAARMAALAVVSGGVLLLAGGAAAHVVVESPSLHLRVAESDLVLRARVEDPAAVFESDDGAMRRPVVAVRVLETLKGEDPGETLRFATHGHGVARYARGEEVLVFLRPTARSRELDALAAAGGPAWLSTQEHDARYVLTPAHRDVVLDAVRGYVRAAGQEDAGERRATLRAVTLDLLSSGDARLAASALGDLAVAAGPPLLRADDLPRLEKLLADPEVSMGVRAGLLAVLERQGLVDGPERWVALLDGAAAASLPAAIRAAGAAGGRPSAAVRAKLVALLADPRPGIAAEAAIALGRPGNEGAVPALAEALGADAPRLRQAAVRGLASIPGDAARGALERAAASHPDPATRRRAAAALRTRERRPAAD